MTGKQVVLLGTIAAATAACAPDPPSQCGSNVTEVSLLDFSGSNTITVVGDDDYEGYAVTAAIVRSNPQEQATICYAVRDEDPFYKLFWAIDDVLDANALTFPVGQDTRTFEGNFVLYAKDGDEVCGLGALPGTLKVAGCSGEREAEVYIHPYGSEGARSPVRKIAVQ